ncbi:MAG: endopeptidase La [Proteobacteria bacterium]|nr:endopeptidase La [Pseudomonadota bacterium]
MTKKKQGNNLSHQDQHQKPHDHLLKKDDDQNSYGPDVDDPKTNRPLSPQDHSGEQHFASQQISDEITMPLLPLKDIVVFPHMIVPVFIGEQVCIKAVEEALRKDKKIFLSAFKVPGVDSFKHACDQDPPYDVYNIGTVCSVMRTRKLPDGRMKVLVQGLHKAHLNQIIATKDFPLIKVAKIIPEQLTSPHDDHVSSQLEAMIRSVRENLEQLVNLGKVLSPDILLIVEDVKDPLRLSDLIASNLGLKVQDAQEILYASSPFASLEAVNTYLSREIEVYQIQMKIQSQAKEEMNKAQREHYLREQIKVLKLELGDHDAKDELEEMWQKLENCPMSVEAREEVTRHLKRLQKMHQESSEAVMCRTYVETMLSLPWQKKSQDNLALKKVEEVLETNHFGIKSVKERILEYLAVKKLNPNLNPPILCFLGPPGVGKTSLGRSIAHAMNRKFERISLGGVRDDAEIRGHRKTYVGSYPGRVISAIKKAQVTNPVIMLDEIDKLCHDHRGDPASALLEILDPNQNTAFCDHYLGVPFDVSSVMFIANANSLDSVPHPLRDRLEIIEVSGYSFEEKIQIAQNFLVPKQLSDNGLNPWNIRFSKGALQTLIQGYTKESGLRGLEKKIASVCRKQARKIAELSEKASIPTKSVSIIKITPSSIEKFLGARAILDDFYHLEPEVGVALGMAYTYFGGEVLAIEVNVMPAPKTGLVLTGLLGNVMKESASAALSYLRANQESFGIPAGAFDNKEFHIHVPAGAVSKDGPSAGIAITTALLSALLRIPPKAKTCLTGELTLHGKVLPIGGLKEKILAAQREGLSMAILPEKNRSAYHHLPIKSKKKLQVCFVNSYFEVFEIMFAEHATDMNKHFSPTPLQAHRNIIDKAAG